MKLSKTALEYYILGIICGISGTIISIVKEPLGIGYFTFGISFLNLFWIMGIQYDLYRKEVKK